MNIRTKISSGDKELISSGNFISFNDDERITIEIINDEASLSIAFEFITDKDDKEVKKATQIDGTCLIIKLYNYSDVRFTTEPWEVGNLYKRKLYILYHIDPLHQTKIRNITYSFYLGEEVNNG